MTYGLLGKSLPHTLSPEIHAAFGTEYGVAELAEERLASFFAARDFLGINVTVPYKQAVIPYLDELSETAKEANAVNTVVNRGGKLIGYNTDVFGMEYALSSRGVSLKNKSVMLLGSGGTSHTAKYLCEKSGAKNVWIVSRSGKINYENCYTLSPQILINTTPVGMYPNCDRSPVDLLRFTSLEFVFDAVYNPLKTALTLSAKARGIDNANGLLMLVAQAKKSEELFFDKRIADGEIVRVTNALRARLTNVAIVGMAGSGKTEVGKRLARLLDREFIDVDCEIEKREGISIPEIFQRFGEAHFREIEREEIARAASRFSAVIATGGGAVLSEKSRMYLKQNCFVVWLKRDESQLALSGRPLSKDMETAKRLSAERAPIYEEISELCVINDGTIEEAAEKIRRGYEENIGR